MKIIDETGKLFGKINLIDFLVILFLISLIPAFYAGYKIMTAKPVEEPLAIVEPPKQPEKEKVKIKVKFKSLDTEICKFIKPGDRQTKVISSDSDKDKEEVIARIVRIISNKPAEVISLNKDITGYTILEHPQTRDIILDIEVLCLRNPEGISFQGRPVKIGKGFEFSTSRYYISGIIIDIDLK